VDAAQRLKPDVPGNPPGLRFCVLGRLEAYDDGVELDLGPRKQRAVLALLLLNANHVVSTERLIDDLWGDSPPSTARATLQVYVAGLRKALGSGGASLRTRAPGYVLELDAGALDLDRFTQLRAEARESSDAEHRAALFHEALMLWRDEPLPELRTEPFSTAAVAHLDQLRLAALEERIDADLALGREAALVSELESLVAEHPYRERLRAQLMLALYRSGRQADALDAYQAGRRVLQDDLGLEPGNELRNLEAAILRQDEALSPAPPVPAAEPDQPHPPRRLSRRAVIVAGAGGLAAVALGGGVTAIRLRGSGATLVHPESVGVVDPVAREVVDEIPVGFSSPLIAGGDGVIWLVDQVGSTLTGIDPKTNDFVLGRTAISVEGFPTGLAAEFESVWIGLIEGNVLSVLELEPELGNLRKRIPLEKRDTTPYSRFIVGVTLTVGEGAVWALERGLGRVRRIDPETKIPELFLDGVSGAASSIAVYENAVWLGGGDGVTKFDLRERYELDSTDEPQVLGSLTTSIAIDREAVWFVGDASTLLWRIDPRSVSVRNSFEIGPSPSAVALGEDGTVWVADGTAASLWRLDPKTDEHAEPIEVGATSGGLVADFGKIWTSPGAAAP
jgi:DNA-binding SARP family transcriptional activator/streptogramin lyase